MQSNSKKLLLLIGGGVIIIGGFAVFLFSNNNTSTSKTGNKTGSALNIKSDLYTSIATPRDFGQSVSTSEPGFGRENPFAPYK